MVEQSRENYDWSRALEIFISERYYGYRCSAVIKEKGFSGLIVVKQDSIYLELPTESDEDGNPYLHKSATKNNSAFGKHHDFLNRACSLELPVGIDLDKNIACTPTEEAGAYRAIKISLVNEHGRTQRARNIDEFTSTISEKLGITITPTP